MPRYYFHLYSPELMLDEVGQHFAGIRAAEEEARRGAGELIAEQIARGKRVNLADRIEVEDDEGIAIVLKFRDLFTDEAE
jgi:hypothetical protein